MLPGESAVFDSARPGAALLEGWSDAGAYRVLLPWPEETRVLPWGRESEWVECFRELEREIPIAHASEASAPFLGGWVGFVAYEAAASGEGVGGREGRVAEPALFFARHGAGVVVDAHGHAVAFGDIPAEASRELRDSLGGGEHRRCVERIRSAIRDGDVYQVNLTRAFSVARHGEDERLYRALTGAEPPRCSAYIKGDGWAIASASPEVLLRFDRGNGVAETRPIKGTVKRGGDDAAEIAALLASEKDAAEHLMIVDVSRNDLGKVAPPGSVSVAAYRTVRTLEYVHHLESSVRATGLHGVDAADVLAALSPAASITGAPKRAACALIRELEPVPRGVYCGSIGFISSTRVEMSVAIRTAVATADTVRYHAGGGIVWDSDPDAEDEESFAKAAAFLRYAGVR